MQFGDITLDRAARKLIRTGLPQTIPAKAFDLLVFLAENPGRPLLKEELMQAVWPDSIVEEANLSHNVFLVRKALGTEAGELIVTLPGRGYQFTAHVVGVPDVMSSLAAPAYGGALEAQRTHLIYEEETEDRIEIWKSPLAMALIAAGVVLLVVAGWLGWERYEDRVGGPPVQVVMADFDGGTGDPVLDRTLKDVLRFELMQSPFITVVEPPKIRDLMTQMRRDPSERLTMELARDACERTGSQAVLHGSLARVGRRFVLVEEATNCVDGATIGTAKQDVGNVEDLPAAVNEIAATLRHDMGESRRMIARFNKPLSSQNTNSLEALKDFSQADYMSDTGKKAEALDLLKQAVQLDPRFAAAYFNLYAYSFNILDAVARHSDLQKAYDLREFATEPIRLAITTYYQAEFTEDFDAGLRSFRMWVSIYPKDIHAWNGLANIAIVMNEHAEAVSAAKRYLELNPEDAQAYYTLALAQMQNDDNEAARKTCDLALSKGMNTEFIHLDLLDLGHLTHDAALVAQQEQWAQDHLPAPLLQTEEADFALDEGRAAAASELYRKAEDAYRQQGDEKIGMVYRQGAARAYFELGWPDTARALLQVAPIPSNTNTEPVDLIALVETGNSALAESLLQKQLAEYPQATLWNQCYAPEIRAYIDRLDNRPADALAVMAPLNGTDLDDMMYPRGLAYMETNQLPQAEAEFRKVVGHPGVDPTSFEVPLATLQLARVLAREGRKDDAIKQYQVFLQLWSHADPNAILVKQANAELASMQK